MVLVLTSATGKLLMVPSCSSVVGGPGGSGAIMSDVESGSRRTAVRWERSDDMSCAKGFAFQDLEGSTTKHERTLEGLERRDGTRARVSGLDEIPSPTPPRSTNTGVKEKNHVCVLCVCVQSA